MRKLMTTEEYFHKICNILEEKNLMPDILDYALAASNSVSFTIYKSDLKSKLNYGNGEGIYLDLWIEYFVDGKKCISSVGTFKTLREDREAMYIMAKLLADFIIEERAYMDTNLDDCIWEGVEIYIFNESGEKLDWGYSCASMEDAIKRKDELLKKYPRVVIRDQKAKKEESYK